MAMNAPNTRERRMPNTVLNYLPWTQSAFQKKKKKAENKNQADAQLYASILLCIYDNHKPIQALESLIKEERRGGQKFPTFYPCKLVVFNVPTFPANELVLF